MKNRNKRDQNLNFWRRKKDIKKLKEMRTQLGLHITIKKEEDNKEVIILKKAEGKKEKDTKNKIGTKDRDKGKEDLNSNINMTDLNDKKKEDISMRMSIKDLTSKTETSEISSSIVLLMKDLQSIRDNKDMKTMKKILKNGEIKDIKDKNIKKETNKSIQERLNTLPKANQILSFQNGKKKMTLNSEEKKKENK